MTKRIFNAGIVVGIITMLALKFGAAAQMHALLQWLSTAELSFSASSDQHFGTSIKHNWGKYKLFAIRALNAPLSGDDDRQVQRLKVESSPTPSEPSNRRAKPRPANKPGPKKSNTSFLYGIAMLSVLVIHQKPVRRKSLF